METGIALPEVNRDFWKKPEGFVAMAIIALLGYAGFHFVDAIVNYVTTLFVDVIHMIIGFIELMGLLWLIFDPRPRMFARILVRAFTSLFVPVFAVQIVKDKLKQMMKRRDKMNVQIGLVKGHITELQRIMAKNEKDANQGFSQASFAKKSVATAGDDTEALRLELAARKNARFAERRKQSNIGYAALLLKLNKVYNFLTRYAANVDFFIEDTEDDINQKTTEFRTVNDAYGAMKTAMSVIAGNATENDIYSEAFDYMEQTVSSRLGAMDDLQRISQDFMTGMDLKAGAVDEEALKALDAFEQKTLTPGTADFHMYTDSRTPVTVSLLSNSNSSTFNPFN